MHPVANVLSIQIAVSKAQNVTQVNVQTHLMENVASTQNVQVVAVLQENVSSLIFLYEKDKAKGKGSKNCNC